jgi:predicted ester cyclase
MTETQVNLARKFFELQYRDLESLPKLLSEEFILKGATFHCDMPILKKAKTVNDYVDWLKEMKRSFCRPKFEILNIFCAENRVCFYYTLDLVFEGEPWNGIKPTGKTMHTTNCLIFSFEKDKISHIELISDEMHRWIELGLNPVDQSQVMPNLETLRKLFSTDPSEWEKLYNPKVEMLHLGRGAKGEGVITGVKGIIDFAKNNKDIMLNPKYENVRHVISGDGSMIVSICSEKVGDQLYEWNTVWEFDDQHRIIRERRFAEQTRSRGTA